MTYTYATDSVVVDTSKAPWMDIARSQMAQGIRESGTYKDFKDALLAEQVQTRVENGIDALRGPVVPVSEPSPTHGMAPRLEEAGASARATLPKRNRRIVEYLDSVRTDPSLDPGNRGRSWRLAPVIETDSGWEMTHWCAAFVNWCLQQAGAPSLGYATAKSWLRFGTPLATPVPGCVTVLSRRGGGHVAFFVKRQGSWLHLLGGNQSDRVRISRYRQSRLLGYRWPTGFDHTRTAAHRIS